MKNRSKQISKREMKVIILIINNKSNNQLSKTSNKISSKSHHNNNSNNNSRTIQILLLKSTILVNLYLGKASIIKVTRVNSQTLTLLS